VYIYSKESRHIVELLHSPQVLRHLGPDGEVTIPLRALLTTSGKMVTFNEKDEEMVFRGDSAIQANTAKNRKKAEKKRLRAERRTSESDVGSMEPEAKVQLVPTRIRQLTDDSGFASSLDDTFEMESFAVKGPSENRPNSDNEVTLQMASEMFKIDM
jgi:hypothetical protein